MQGSCARLARSALLVSLIVACGSDGAGPSVEQELRNRLVFETEGGMGVMAPDGSQRAVVPVGGDLDLAQDATVSPDGRRVAFVGSRDGLLDLYVMNVDGSERHQLTSDSAQDLSPAWSPNGATLLFHRAEIAPQGRPVLMLIGADGSGRKQLRVDASGADWSPDGQRVAFTGSGTLQGVYVMDHDGSDVTSLADVCGPDCEDDSGPRWSPDGQLLAFTRSLPGGTDAVGVMRADGREARLILPTLDAGGPVWSPDGVQLALTRTDGEPRIYVVTLASSDTVRLAGGFVTDWAP